jgi:hypothetical protein
VARLARKVNIPLVDESIEGAGGAERFDSTSELIASIRSGGVALPSKGVGGPFKSYTARISTTEPRTVFEPYPESGSIGVFEGDRVSIQSAAGQTLSERLDPRAAFRRSLRRQFRWDPLDGLYFAGYALWNYFNVPFLFRRPGFELREIEPYETGGLSWRRLAVTFPADVPTHSRDQVFYFDSETRLRRLDYTAEVFGGWARAAHVCHDDRNFGGLIYSTRRRVTPRLPGGRPAPGPTIVSLAIDDVQLAS